MKRELEQRRFEEYLKDPIPNGKSEDLWRVPWKRLGFDYCGLYLICQRTRWPIKVGISNFVASRLDGLQTSHWNELIVGKYYLCENRNSARALETAVHGFLAKEAGRRLLGEWFDISCEAASSIVEFAAEKEAISIETALPRTEKFNLVREYLGKSKSKMRSRAYTYKSKKLLGVA